MEYRREIDGLRALAVLPVVLFHAGVGAFGGGFVGVDVFFVISGYLITSIIISELASGTFTIANFYERRARRILPALVVVVLATLPAAWYWLLPGAMREFSESIIAVFTFVSNILFWRSSGYFDTEAELKPLLHTWSLAVEEQYYLFFPLFLSVMWRFGRRNIEYLLIAFGVISIGLAQWGAAVDPTAAFYLLPTRGWELLIGALAAFYLSREGASAPRVSRPWVGELGSMVGFLCVVVTVFAYSRKTPFPGFYALVPTAGTVLIILYAGPSNFAGRLLARPAMVGIGLVSYSAYLWHQPLFAFARIGFSAEAGGQLMLLLAVCSFGLAYLSWRFVEAPFRNKRQFSRKRVFGLSLGASVAFIAFGVIGLASGGFESRYPVQDRSLAGLQLSEVGKYVSKRFNSYAGKPFNVADERRKILVIGDSFAQDLVNAIHEGGFEERFQVRTRHVSHHCGNLFIPQSAFVARVAEEEMHRCRNRGLFEDAALRKQMLESDEIWFVSRWLPWQAELVTQSLANLNSFAAKRVLVYGVKDFGVVDIKTLLALDPVQRMAVKGVVGDETIATNSSLRARLPAAVFVDVQTVLCGADERACPLFRGNAELVSHDGRHLTEFGARYLGEGLARAGLLQGR